MAQRPEGLDFNLVNILRIHLKERLHQVLEDTLVKDELKEYEKKLRPLIRSQIKKITLGTVEGYRDNMHMRDEIHVFCHWEDKDVKNK